MKPVTVTTTIERPREAVYALLDDLPAHEAFTDHFIVDWRRTETGVRVKGKAGGGEMEITVVESTPDRIVEHGRSGKDMRRRTKGIYSLEPAGAAATIVSFTNEIEPAGPADRLLGPVMRAYLRRQNARALERLKGLLENGSTAAA
jgi:hypothetical protein